MTTIFALANFALIYLEFLLAIFVQEGSSRVHGDLFLNQDHDFWNYLKNFTQLNQLIYLAFPAKDS